MFIIVLAKTTIVFARTIIIRNEAIIPEYFAPYNAHLLDVNRYGFSPQFDYFASHLQTYGKSSDCIACKKCEKIGPQHLHIIGSLKDVEQKLGGVFAMMSDLMPETV